MRKPTRSSKKVSLNNPENSGVTLEPTLLDVSSVALAENVAFIVLKWNGRAVVMLMVEPMPPLATSARPVLYTWIPEMPSAERFSKSKERVAVAAPTAPLPATPSTARFPGMERPFKVTRLNSGPKPRTVTRVPSLSKRSMVTPGMRWMASARLVSGNLPMSSEVMASTIPLVSRLMVSLVTSDWRRPVTTISPRLSPGAGAAVVSVATAGSAIAPEQYIAISTARGFIGRGDDGRCAIFEAHGRLDFFTVLSPPVFRDHIYSVCRHRWSISLQAVSETGCRPILPLAISKCKGSDALKSRANRRHGTLPLTSAALCTQHS